MWTMLALVQAAAAPLPAAIEEDLTCIAVVSMAVQSTPVDKQAGLVGGLMYFMGRIDRAAPGFDYASELARLIRAKDGEAKLRAAAPRCGTILQERGTSMQRWGGALREAGRK